jgi:prepilin-type N-terminal cleavage/methylation domain-containing protein
MIPGRRTADSRPGALRNHGEGFTLLEVLVALVVLAVGAAVTMSVLSGSLGNIRKVQLRTRVMEYAQNKMEEALYRQDLREPATYTENLEEGYSYVLKIEEYEPEIDTTSTFTTNVDLPIRLLSYRVELFAPGSPYPVYQLQTLKIINTLQEGALPGSQ